MRAVEQVLELAIAVILRSVTAQIDAGAKAIFIAEPAANKVFLSPNQIEDGADIFERYVMQYNRRLKALLDARGVDIFFHCCGEITPYMLEQFCELDPAILAWAVRACSGKMPPISRKRRWCSEICHRRNFIPMRYSALTTSWHRGAG